MEQKTVVKEKLGKRYLQGAVVATAFALPVLARAEGETGLTPEQVTAAGTSIGMPALIGAAVVFMLGVGVLIWGGKRIIGFFSK